MTEQNTVTATLKVIKTNDLRWVNGSSYRAKYNRTLAPHFLDQLDPDGIHVVAFSTIHNDDHVRAMILCKVRGTMAPAQVYLDMSFEEFNALAEVGPTDAQEEA